MKKEQLQEIGVKRKGEVTIPEEVSPWIKKQEKGQPPAGQQKKPPVVTNDKGQTILAPADSPVTQSAPADPLGGIPLTIALKQKTSDAIRWLAESIKKIQKINVLKKNDDAN